MSLHLQSSCRRTRVPTHLSFLFYFMLLASSSYSQAIKITGTIKDAEGVGIPAVTVAEKNTTNGVVSDVEGNYEISVSDSKVTLVFTSVGFTTKEVRLTGLSKVDVVLEQAITALNELVVVGYGTQKKVTVVGSVVQVKGAELQKSPSVNLSNNLVGRVPGITAVNANGEPGRDGSTLKIRGTNAFGNTSPLIVIDGVPDRSGGLDRLNPADIESVSILKDASAAIYGQRSANGVILVTTKRGKKGKPQLSYNFNQGWAQPANLPKMLDAVAYGNLRNEIATYAAPPNLWGAALTGLRNNGSYSYTAADGSTARILSPSGFGPDDMKKYADGSDPWGHPNTNWLKTVLKNWAPQQRHHLQVNGGSDNVKYLTSLGYINQGAIYNNSATGYKQFDLRLNMDIKVTENINVSLGVTGRQEDRRSPTVPANDIFRMLVRGRPQEPAIWPNGLPAPDIENGQQPVVISTNQTGYIRDKRDYFQSNGKVEIKIPGVEGLKVTGIASADKYIQNLKTWRLPWYLYKWDGASYEADGTTPKLTKYINPPGYDQPQLDQSSVNEFAYTLSSQVNYDRQFGDHSLSAMVGTQKEYLNNQSLGAARKYFISAEIGQLDYGSSREQSNRGAEYERARMGYFGRLGYNYKEKYLLELVGRYDGSYLFPKEQRFGFFPGVMAGWRISEENFFKSNLRFANDLKLRASWGQVGAEPYKPGTVDLATFQYLHSYALGTSTFPGDGVLLSLYESVLANPNFTWEVQTSVNLALEGALFNNRLIFNLEYFTNKRDKALYNQSGIIPGTAGILDVLPPVNYARLDNRGWEFALDYRDRIGEIKYNFGVNGGYVTNKIVKWNEPDGVPPLQRSTGYSFGTMGPNTTGPGYLVYEYDGVYASQADIDASTLDYTPLTGGGYKLRPGDMKLKDISGPDGKPDGKISDLDRRRLNKTLDPKFTYGINGGLQYKNFDLSILFQGATGGAIFERTESGAIGNYTQWDYENRWSVENPSSVYPRIVDRDNNNPYYANPAQAGNNTYYLRSTRYLRFKNLEIGYNVPGSLLKHIGISRTRVYCSGLNLVTWDKLRVVDPESVVGNAQYYPQSRIINIGAVVTF